MDIASLIISIVSFLLAFVSAIFSWRVHKQTVIHDKKQATLDAINILQVQVFDELYDYTNSQIAVISQNNRSEEYKRITKLMARIEHFSVGVNSDIYSLDITKRLAGRHFCSIYDKVLPMIKKKRETFKDDKHYDEFEKLVDELNFLYQK